jgi:hypothetical protein
LDQTIEEVFDETNFERKLDDIIKKYAFSSLKNKKSQQETFNSLSDSSTLSDSYLTNDEKRDLLDYFKVHPDSLCTNIEISFLEQSFVLLKYAQVDKLMDNYKNLSESFLAKLDHVSATSSCKTKKYVSSKPNRNLTLRFLFFLSNPSGTFSRFKRHLYQLVQAQFFRIHRKLFFHTGQREMECVKKPHVLFGQISTV